MDIFDRAQEHIERETPMLLAQRKPVRHTVNGKCHNCGEPVATGLYCDAACREDFEKREARGQD